jgi:hypothetical protein
MVDASEYNNCADVTADAVSYYLYRFEFCQDYKKLIDYETQNNSNRKLSAYCR